MHTTTLSHQLSDSALRSYVATRAWLVTTRHALADEAGEGVISAAIAVLIMAFLGALMWFGFKAMWADAETNTRAQVNQIGT